MKTNWCAGDIIILHMCTKNHNHVRYGSWEKKEIDTIFCHFEPFFALSPPNNPENQNFEEMKQIPGDIIILHLCTINETHMMYASWDMEHERHNFLSFWTIFCPFENFEKKKKKSGDIILHMCTINDSHMMYGSWDMKHERHNFCHFGPFHALLSH